MTAKKTTHVNCGGPYPIGPGEMLGRGEEYAPSAKELKNSPRRWAPIGSKRAVMAVPKAGVTVVQSEPTAAGEG